MRRPGLCLPLLLLVILVPFSSLAADSRTVVAVFDVQTERVKLDKSLLNLLTNLLGQELGVGGVYQVMPPGDVKRALMEQSAESYKECYDEKCQISLGRQLPANKLVTTIIMKVAGQCRVAVSLYDLRRQTTDIVAKAKCPCTEAGLAPALEKAAATLRDWAGGTASDIRLPAVDAGDKPIEPSASDLEYKRALAVAWRKLTQDAREGTAEQKLEKYQTFLANFPTDNPHAAEVQKNIDALESKLEKQEAARLKAEEQKAALAAKRARAKNLKAAYNAAKGSRGSSSEQLALWEKFLSDYPDDNPYEQTARRKTKDIKRRAEAEAREAAKRVPKGMVMVPAGEFWMGCNPKVDGECGADEKPGRKVYLDAYLIDKTEVTVEQYGRCVQANKCKKPSTGKDYNKGQYNWGEPGRSKHPINGVSWTDAKTYCESAGKRLPTEAEWEKAARGTDGRKNPWGDQRASCLYAVIWDGGFGCGKKQTWPVCSKEKGNSPYGLCDMLGNVHEWVHDWYGKDYYSSGPKRNPSGPSSGRDRVERGGSWSSEPTYVRASRRSWGNSGNRSQSNGIRCARSFSK